jgi:hypothetical protein
MCKQLFSVNCKIVLRYSLHDHFPFVFQSQMHLVVVANYLPPSLELFLLIVLSFVGVHLVLILVVGVHVENSFCVNVECFSIFFAFIDVSLTKPLEENDTHSLWFVLD